MRGGRPVIDAAVPGVVDDQTGAVTFAAHASGDVHDVTDEIARRAWLSDAREAFGGGFRHAPGRAKPERVASPRTARARGGETHPQTCPAAGSQDLLGTGASSAAAGADTRSLEGRQMLGVGVEHLIQQRRGLLKIQPRLGRRIEQKGLESRLAVPL